jgi:GntR family transcriptional regulator
MKESAAVSSATQTALSRENPISLYEQIACRLQEEIEAGHYEPSGRLPSESQLGERFDVSRVTVRLALDKLTAEGRIVRRQGKGSYVAGKQVRHGLDTLRSFHESLRQQGLNAGMRLLDKQRVEIPLNLLQRFAPATQAMRLERLHLVDEQPVALGISYLPDALNAASWEVVEQQPAYSLLTSLMGEAPARADMAIRAQGADAELAEVLQTQIGEALLVLERTSYFTSGACCDHSCFYIRPERYEFVLSSTFRLQP